MTGQALDTAGGRSLIADRAYFDLRDRIVTLALPPGAALREDELMRELQTGRTPLREAVKRLALESLVEIKPRRGTFVTEIEVADIVHITEVRAELEGAAAQMAAVRMDDADREAAEALLAEIDALDLSLGGDALLRLDERVHRLAWDAARNPYLLHTLEGYWALSLRLWHLVLDRVPGLPGAVHDQRRLLEALLARDGELARAALRDHVLAFQREVVAALSR